MGPFPTPLDRSTPTRAPLSQPTPASTEEPPRKRIRLSNDIPAAVTVREAEPGTALEIDHMILDYLAFHATNACLEYRQRFADRYIDVIPMSRSLVLVDNMLTLFKARYPRHELDEALQFRLSLLRLVALFTQRLTRTANTPSLQSSQLLRAKNRTRAREWIAGVDGVSTEQFRSDLFDAEFPLSDDILEVNRVQTLRTLGVPARGEVLEGAFYGTSACLSLLDILPMFMEVSAACQVMYASQATEEWMTLAVQWMLQACLEQYLMFGAHGPETIEEAFAWGFDGHIIDYEDTSASGMHDELGCEEPKIEFWKETRDMMLRQLFASPAQRGEGVTLVAHLEVLSTHLSLRQTETEILEILRNFSKAIAEPVITQLEHGRLDGMNEGQTQAFLRSCGLAAISEEVY